MRFLILLVATAFATKCFKRPAAPGATAVEVTTGQCHTGASDTTPTACLVANCAFGAANVSNQWVATAAAYDLAKEATRACTAAEAPYGAALVKADCDKCKEHLYCRGDTAKAAMATVAAKAGPTTTCKVRLGFWAGIGAAQESCKANAAWVVAPKCASDTALADPAHAAGAATAEVFGATGTTCTETISDTCFKRFGCADFATNYLGKVTKPAATTEPAGTCADAKKVAQTALKTKKDCEAVTGNVWTVTKVDKTKKSPAAMISAGIALIALLF